MSDIRVLTARRWIAGLVATAVLLAGAAFLLWQHFYPVEAAAGWSVRVYLDDLPKVSALAKDPEGNLFVSQEQSGRQGMVLVVDRDGRRQRVLEGLTKPDGLQSFKGGIAISQEVNDSPVILLRHSLTQVLFSGNSIEGLASDGHHLFAIEDRKAGGRLLKFDPTTGAVSTLREGLTEAEGVAICPDGGLFYSEKGRGWVRKYAEGGDDPIVAAALNQPSFLLCNAAGVWLTEDATHRARLLHIAPDGSIHTVLSGLRSGQTILEIGPGRFLVAEQGRGRILELTRVQNAAQ